MDANNERKPEKLSLYDRLGGSVFIELAVDKFCDRMLADPRLQDLFTQVNSETLKKKIGEIAAELCKNVGAKPSVLFENPSIPFSLTESQFNRGISHLIASLVWIGMNRELIEEVLDRVSPLSSVLVSTFDADLTQTDRE